VHTYLHSYPAQCNCLCGEQLHQTMTHPTGTNVQLCGIWHFIIARLVICRQHVCCITPNTQVNVVNMTTTRFYYLTMIDYQLFHLCLTFWLPFTIIVICYAYTTSALCRYNCETNANCAERWRVRYQRTQRTRTTPLCKCLRLISQTFVPYDHISVSSRNNTKHVPRSCSLQLKYV
jgi:hypothetical protein